MIEINTITRHLRTTFSASRCLLATSLIFVGSNAYAQQECNDPTRPIGSLSCIITAAGVVDQSISLITGGSIQQQGGSANLSGVTININVPSDVVITNPIIGADVNAISVTGDAGNISATANNNQIIIDNGVFNHFLSVASAGANTFYDSTDLERLKAGANSQANNNSLIINNAKSLEDSVFGYSDFYNANSHANSFTDAKAEANYNKIVINHLKSNTSYSGLITNANSVADGNAWAASLSSTTIGNEITINSGEI